MGVKIVAKGVDSEAYATEYSATVRRGLEAVFFTNTDLSKIARNYAPGKSSGSVVGAPVPATSNTALVNNTNYVQTQITETAETTTLAIFRKPAPLGSGSLAFFGNYLPGVLTGLSIYRGSNGGVAASAGFGADDATNQALVTSVIPPDITQFGLYSVVVDATGVAIKAHTVNLSSKATPAAGTPRRPSTRQLRIGSSYSSSFTGDLEMVAVMHYSVALTADELTKAATDLRAYAARRGIVV